MGNVLVSLDSEKELLLRRFAKELYSNKKGSISMVVSRSLDELAKKDRKLRAAKHQLALMKKGFSLGLKNKKAYEERGEIYD